MILYAPAGYAFYAGNDLMVHLGKITQHTPHRVSTCNELIHTIMLGTYVNVDDYTICPLCRNNDLVFVSNQMPTR